MDKVCQTAQALSSTISYPLKHMVYLPPSRPSDWGAKVTVCIGATFLDKWLVTASDQKLSMPGMFSGDLLMAKIDPIHPNWCAMVSGDDITLAIPIWDRARKKLGFETGRETEPPGKTLEELRDAVTAAYQEERERQIADRFLKPHNLTHDEFVKSRKLLGDYVFSNVWGEVDRFDLERITFLVAGFDKFKRGHVFTIENPGVYKNYDPTGFWAIGSGQYLALASLFLSDMRTTPPSFETLIYEVCAAKFLAEAEGNVGKGTSLIVYEVGKPPEYYDEEGVKQIRQLWESSAKPKRHHLTEETIRNLKKYSVKSRH